MNEVLFILAYFNVPCGLHFIRCCQDLECSGTLYIIPLSIIFPDALFSLYSPLKSPMKIVLYYIASQSIPGRMIVSEIEGHESYAVFLECTVAITCLHLNSAIFQWNVATPSPSKCK